MILPERVPTDETKLDQSVSWKGKEDLAAPCQSDLGRYLTSYPAPTQRGSIETFLRAGTKKPPLNNKAK